MIVPVRVPLYFWPTFINLISFSRQKASIRVWWICTVTSPLSSSGRMQSVTSSGVLDKLKKKLCYQFNSNNSIWYCSKQVIDDWKSYFILCYAQIHGCIIIYSSLRVEQFAAFIDPKGRPVIFLGFHQDLSEHSPNMCVPAEDKQ